MDAVTVVRAALRGTSKVSSGLAARWAYRLFREPQGRSRLRTAERPLFDRAERGEMTVNGANVVTYRWGDGRRPVLVVHGWESRASRFSAIIEELLDRGYSPVSFDAPGHGESTGQTTTVLDYVQILTHLHREHGDFEAIVAHSLGVTSTFMAFRHGLRTDRLVAISGVPEFGYLVDKFCRKLGLGEKVRVKLAQHVERRLFPGEVDMWTRFAVFPGVDELGDLPILLIQDSDDDLVDAPQAERIKAALGDRAHLVTTEGFGHRRILGAEPVVRQVIDFVSVGGEQPLTARGGAS